MYSRYIRTSQFYIIHLSPTHPPYLHLLCSRTCKIMLSVDSTYDDELDSSRLVKLFLPLLLGHMSTGRSEVNKHIKQLRTYKNTFYVLYRYGNILKIYLEYIFLHDILYIWYSWKISRAPIYEDFEVFGKPWKYYPQTINHSSSSISAAIMIQQ